MPYRIEFAPASERTLRRLPRDDQRRVELAIKSLYDQPRARGAIKLTGTRDTYRIRAGPFRIIYEIDDTQQLIVITKVARRSERTYRIP